MEKAVDSPLAAEPMRKRTASTEEPASPEKAGGSRTSDGVAAWLPEHAQRLVKRHLGSDPFDAALPESPHGMKVLQVRDLPIDSGIVDSADVAGGIAADDAAAGDAAVLALVADKCAPAASNDLPHLAEKLGQSLSSPTMKEPDCSPTSSLGAQYFNLWESDPDCEEAEQVHQWLRKMGLGRYFEQLAAEGFDNMSILANLEEKQIAELMDVCPMPSLHEQQLRRGLARLNTDGGTDGMIQTLAPMATMV